MNTNESTQVRELGDAVYRAESRRGLATLFRLLGDFVTAEEALHEAFAVAVERWSREGVPDNPPALMVSTSRFKAIMVLRAYAGFDASLPDLARQLTTEEIAKAFFHLSSTLAQRIVRDKTKIRRSRIPYVMLSETDLPDRLDAVLQVGYLVFNEGYSASSGGSLIRHDLSTEALGLGRLLVEWLTDPETTGLLALMLLHDSRRNARISSSGEPILLDDQDRSLWKCEQNKEGAVLVEQATQ